MINYIKYFLLLRNPNKGLCYDRHKTISALCLLQITLIVIGDTPLGGLIALFVLTTFLCSFSLMKRFYAARNNYVELLRSERLLNGHIQIPTQMLLSGSHHIISVRSNSAELTLESESNLLKWQLLQLACLAVLTKTPIEVVQQALSQRKSNRVQFPLNIVQRNKLTTEQLLMAMSDVAGQDLSSVSGHKARAAVSDPTSMQSGQATGPSKIEDLRAKVERLSESEKLTVQIPQTNYHLEITKIEHALRIVCFDEQRSSSEVIFPDIDQFFKIWARTLEG